MKTIKTTILLCLTLFITIGFISCEDANEELNASATIENKIDILKSGEWLVKGFETNVMHTFADGKRFTFYGTDGVFVDEPIPGTQAYTISGDLLIMDFNFGNVFTYEVKVSCDNNIVEFFKDGELNTTLYRRGSTYMQCL